MALNPNFLNNLNNIQNKSPTAPPSAREPEVIPQKATPDYPIDEIVIPLHINILTDFPISRHNRYGIHEGEKMEELVGSIRHNGILEPLVVRPNGEGIYQIISGKNRRRAAEALSYETVPCIVRELDDDDALLQLNFLNSQHRELRPSEKAYAYELEHQQSNNFGFRSDLTLYHADTRLGDNSLTLCHADTRLDDTATRKTKWRYRQLTKFDIDGFLDVVDNNLIKLGAAIDIASLSPKQQERVYNFFLHVIDTKIIYRDALRQITPEIAMKIKELDEGGSELTDDVLYALFTSEVIQKPSGVLKLKVKTLYKRHPELSHMREQDIEATIDMALTEYFRQRKELHPNE